MSHLYIARGGPPMNNYENHLKNLGKNIPMTGIEPTSRVLNGIGTSGFKGFNALQAKQE